MPGGSPACRRQIVRNSKLEALSQILPLPAMTGSGIVVHYDLFDPIEQFPGILKKRQVFGHTTGHSMNVTVDELNLMLENSEELNGYAQFLKNILGHRCDTLSGGELRKLYVWVASQKKADVLLLDEPTTDLDAQSQAELIDFIKQNRSAQLIIAMTHNKGLIDTTQHVIKAEKGGLFVL